jgi:Flp pilus assembly protein TadG
MIGLNLLRACRAFRHDRRGVSALEFALIAPIMLTAYVGMTELSSAMMNQRRVSHSASAVGDLAAQYQTLQLTDVNNIFAAATIILQPFPTTTLQLRLTSVTQQSGGKYVVDWSEVNQSGSMSKYGVGATLPSSTIPTGLLANTGDSLIISESKYTYTSPIAYTLPTALNFNNAFYLKPRYGSTITCLTCT